MIQVKTTISYNILFSFLGQCFACMNVKLSRKYCREQEVGRLTYFLHNAIQLLNVTCIDSEGSNCLCSQTVVEEGGCRLGVWCWQLLHTPYI